MPEPIRVLRRGAAEVRVFADEAAVIDAVVAELRTLGGPLQLALAGGSTPLALYRRLAAEPDALPWTDAQVWFGDERCVGPEHPDSNYRMAHEALLAPLGVAAERVHRMRGEDEPAQAAQAYADELRAAFGGQALPRFDVVLLGVGEDGHTASLFPGTAATLERTRWVAANAVDKLGVWRLTLTFPVLCAAARVWVLAVGPRKAAIVREVLGDARDPTRWPVQAVIPTDGALVWWIDAAAAAAL